MCLEPSADNTLEPIVKAVIERWPEHVPFIRSGLGARSPELTRQTIEVARLVALLIGDDMDRFVAGYQWMCEMILAEEIEFRRTGRYRHSLFADANTNVYQDQETMSRYMDGLLLSQVLFDNHIEMLDFYRNRFLVGNLAGYRHLEIGPGHGLLLYYAAIDPRCDAVSAWDISPTSIAHARDCLRKLKVARPVDLRLQDVMAPEAGEFDSIVFSEVMEHLESPKQALCAIMRRMAPNGRLFVNVPVNSPAIDHIYLFSKPEEAVDLVASAGFDIIEVRFAPLTGYTEEKARRTQSAISCGIIAKRV